MAEPSRLEQLARRLCDLMGWEYKTCPKLTAMRAVGKGEAVAIGLDKVEEIVRRLEAQQRGSSD